MKANKFKVEDSKVYLDGERVHGVAAYAIREQEDDNFSKVHLTIKVDTAEAEVENPEVETDFDLALPKLVQAALLQTLHEKLPNLAGKLEDKND